MTPTSSRDTPAKRRLRSARNLLLVVPAFAVMGGLSIAAVWILGRLQEARCPAGTFLVGAGQVAWVFKTVPTMLGSIGVGFVAVNWIAHSIPPVRRFFDRDARRHGEPGYQAAQRGLLKASAVLLGITLPISLAASLSQYCLLDSEVLYQRWPWSGLHQYSWHNVRKIETYCTRGKSSWNASFLVVMDDGTQFDLMAWPRDMAQAYSEIARSLRDVDFAFDSSGVRPGCDVRFLGLLTHRP